MTGSRSRTLRELTHKLRRWERTRCGGGGSDALLSTGIGALDGLLPAGSLHEGMLWEWMAAEPASGAGTLAFTSAAALCAKRGACVIIDPERTLYPPAVRRLGIDLRAVLVVHPSGTRDLLWAWEQALRCSEVAVVIGGMAGLRAPDFRRLQLSAEKGGTIGMLLRPARYRPETSWADVRLLVEPLAVTKPATPGTAAELSGRGMRATALRGVRNPAARPFEASLLRERFSRGRRLRVELIHCRGRLSGGSVLLEIDDATGNVRLASRVAAAESMRRTARA